MESPRISLARVLELGVCVSWREALSIAHEAVARAGATEGAGPARLTAESCLLTRGGDVVLAGTAAQARPEVAVRLLDDLLASCSNPGRFSGAVADGTALDTIEQWSQDTTPKRRRAQVASVALRGLAAEADAARAMADADELHLSADFDDLIAAPPPAASPTDFPRPWVTALSPPPAMPTIPDPTFSLLEDADDGNAEVRRPDLDLEDLIAAVEAAPPPAASPTDRLWPRVAALAPPPAMPTIDDQTVALLGEPAVGDTEVRRPDLDHEDLIAAVDAAPLPDASIPEQTFALLEDAAVGDAEVRPSLDLEDLIAAVEAAPPPAASPTDRLWPRVAALAPPSAMPTIDDQTFAVLEDAAVDDAEVHRPGLDLEDLIAAGDAAPLPDASIPEQTFALLEDSAVDAEVRRPDLDHEDLVAAVDATPPPAASIPEQTFALLEDAAVGDAEVRPSLDLEDLIAAVDAAPLPDASIPEQTFALLEDAALGDAEVPRRDLDHEDLIAAVDAAPSPAAAPTDVPWPSLTALAPPSAMPTIDDQTFAVLEDATVDDAEVHRPGLDLEDLIAAGDAAPPPAAALTDVPWPSLTALAPPAASPPIPEQTFALLEDSAVDAEVRRPDLDHEDLVAAVDATPPPAASIPEQTFAVLEDSAVGDAEVPSPGLDLEDLIAAIEAAPPPAASIPEQTFAQLEDSAVDAEVPRRDLDHEDLIAAVDAAPSPAAAPTDVPWPSLTALAPPSAMPTIDDQTFALLEDADVGDAEVRPGLDLEDLIAAVDAAPSPAAAPTDVPWPSVTALAPPSAMPTIDHQTFALLGDSAVGNAEIRRPGLDEAASVALRGLAAEADAANAMADAEEQHPSADVDDEIAAPTPAASPADFPRTWVTALAPPSAMPTIDDQTFALLEDAADDDAEVRRPGLDLEDLIAAGDAAPPPAAPPTDVPWPSLTALAPPSAMPTIPDPAVALLEDADDDDAEVRRPGLDHEALIAAVDAAPAPAAAIPEQTFALLEDSAFDDAEVHRPGLDLEDLIAAGDAAPPPAAALTDVPWPSLTALAPPSAMPTIPDQTFALLEDSADDDAEVRRPSLDEMASVALRGLAVEADAARAMTDAEEQHPSADVDDEIAAPPPAASPTDLPRPWVTVLAPPSPIPTIDDQTFALPGDSAVGDTAVRRPGLDEVASVALRGLAAEADAARTMLDADAARAMADADGEHPSADVYDEIAAPTPAASPTDLPRPWVTVLAPPSPIPTIDDQTFALLGDSAVGDTAVRRPDLDHEDLIAAFEAAREWTAPEDAMAPLAIGTSPAQGTRPSVRLRPASFLMDLPSAKPLVNAVWTYVWGGYASSCDRVRRASPALVCSVLALAAGGILGLQLPETQWSAVEPSEPAIEPPESGAPGGLDGQTPHARTDPALLHEAADRPSVPPLVVRSAPRDSPRIEGRRARFTEVPDSYVWSMPRPARRPETPAKDTATVARSRSLSTTSAAAALVAPGAANSAGAPPPAVDPSSVVASPSATASSPAETFVSASNNMPVNAVARSPDRELETRAIENVLGRYRIAFNRLDAGAALAVWPTVNEKTLANAFERLESHDMSFRSCQIEIISVIAEAACSGSARYVPKVGSRTPKTEERRWRFMLRKARSGWLIETVDAR